MNFFHRFTLVLLLECSVAYSFFSNNRNHGKLLLKDVQALTLFKDQMTTGRRSQPIPQVECANCGNYVPDTVQCLNKGMNGLNANWECKADLPNGIKIKNVEVSCEGYDYPDDPYILEGSCQVSLRVQGSPVYEKTDYGYNNYNSNQRWSSNWRYDYHYNDRSGLSFTTIIFILLALYVVYYAFFRSPRNPPACFPAGYNGYNGYNNAWGNGQMFGTSFPSFGGFWGGLGAGGLLGSLMFRPRGYQSPRYGYGGYSGYSSPSSGNRNSAPSSSTQTGYGTTRRR